MNKNIKLVKGGKVRFVNEKEYRLIKDDMNGWELFKEAPKVPQEVEQKLHVTSGNPVTFGGTLTPGNVTSTATVPKDATITPTAKPRKSKK